MTKQNDTRAGRPSRKFKRLVWENPDNLSDEELIKITGFTAEYLQELRRQKVVIDKDDENVELIAQLHAKHYWTAVCKALLPDEIVPFEKQWANMVNQFSNAEILATDEMQIKDLCLEEIQIARKLHKMREIEMEQTRLRSLLAIEEGKPFADRDQPNIALWRQQLSSYQATVTTLEKNVDDNKVRKDILLKALKATREARLKQVEDRSKNFFGLVTDLDRQEVRKREGDWMAKMALATQKKHDELCQPIEYEDGSVDCPILDPEVIEREKKENERENDK